MKLINNLKNLIKLNGFIKIAALFLLLCIEIPLITVLYGIGKIGDAARKGYMFLYHHDPIKIKYK